MEVDQIVAVIIQEYGAQLWIGFVTLVVTGFVMLLIKQFISNLANYFRAKMSDIGYGQRIYWNNQIYLVEEITFRYIVAKDDMRIIHIPIDTYLSGVKQYPLHRHDDFNEEKYHEKPWDGRIERRGEKRN